MKNETTVSKNVTEAKHVQKLPATLRVKVEFVCVSVKNTEDDV